MIIWWNFSINFVINKTFYFSYHQTTRTFFKRVYKITCHYIRVHSWLGGRQGRCVEIMEIGTKGGVHCDPRGIIIEKSNGSLHYPRRKVVWRREKAGKVDNYYNQNVDSLFLETYNSVIIFQGFVEEFVH